VQFPKYCWFLPIIFFIDNINWFYLHCCKCLKKCCPEMYAAYTQSVEEQSISQKFTRLVTWSCRRIILYPDQHVILI
jgi:hypothetical protein